MVEHIRKVAQGSFRLSAAVSIGALAALVLITAVGDSLAGKPPSAGGAVDSSVNVVPPVPVRAARPPVTPADATPANAKPEPKPALKAAAQDEAQVRALRLKRLLAARSWGYQLASLDYDAAARSPFDMLVADATTGLASGHEFTADEVKALKVKPDGSSRVVLSYLSIGEAEDYRKDYFGAEYLTEESPDWMLAENPNWKGNRLIEFCKDGWQNTIIGHDGLRNAYNETEASPLGKLVELGFDGVYLDRVDIYAEVGKQCPNAKASMIRFLERLAGAARAKNPNFMVIVQNAEELVDDPRVIRIVDGIAKESLFYGNDFGQKLNSQGSIASTLEHLDHIKAAGRAVFVVDYVNNLARSTDVRRRCEAHGFVAYIGPRKLDALWLPGRNF